MSIADTATTRLGRGVVVRGTIRGDGDITIEGHVEGLLDVAGEVEIAESARLRAPVSGERVVVRGAVAGDIRGTSSVVLEDGARVVGDLSAPSVGIRPGGLLRGYVSTSGKSASTASKTARRSAGAPVATPAPRAQRPASLVRAREDAPTQPMPSQPMPSQPMPSQRGVSLPKPPPPRPAPAPPSQKSFVEPIASPLTRPTGKPNAGGGRESSAGGPPPPIVPALKKGARGSMKKKAGR